MSIETLIEAAKYLEMQEHKNRLEAQARATVDTVLNTFENQVASMSPTSTSVVEQQQQHPVSSTTVREIAINTGSKQVILTSTTVETPGLFHSIVTSKPTPVVHTTKSILLKSVSSDKPEQQPQVSSTVNVSHGRVLHNSFDIMNPLVIDDPDAKRRHPPLVFRAGTREVHNKLEKHRRAHLKECFDMLKKQLPQTPDEKKTSNLSILHSSLRYIQSLKRKERECEHEMERLARDKIALQQRLATLKKDYNISCTCENIDFSKYLPQNHHSSSSLCDNADTIILTEPALKEEVEVKSEPVEEVPRPQSSPAQQAVQNGTERLTTIPVLTTTVAPSKGQIAVANGQQVTSIKEVSQQPVQTALSVLPVGYPVSQGLVLQKLIVPKGLTDITPLVQTHFITAPQQLNGKVVPIVNAQYVVKPVVVVSTASPRPS